MNTTRRKLINTLIASIIKSCILFVAITPESVLRYRSVSSVIPWIRLLFVTIMFFIIIYYGYTPSRFIGSFVVLCIILFCTSFINGRSIQASISTVTPILIVCLFVELFLRYNTGNTITVLNFTFLIYVIVNTITLIIYPNGMYQNNRQLWTCWFLGEDNYSMGYYLFTIYIAYIYDFYRHGRAGISSVLSSFLFLFIVFRNDIVQGKIVLFAILLLFVVLRIKKVKPYVTLTTSFISNAIIFLLLMFSNLNSYTALFFQKFINRDVLTFSGRSSIWIRALSLFFQKPIFGYGIYNGDSMEELLRIKGITAPHNIFLSFALWGGILSICILIYMILQIIRESKWFRRNQIYYLSVIIVFAYIFRHQFESGSIALFCLLLCVTYYQSFIEIKT